MAAACRGRRRWAGGGGPRGLADDQAGPFGEGGVLDLLAAQGEEHARGGRAHPLHLLVDGGQPGVQPGTERQVVVADDGHVPRDGQPGTLRGADAADRHRVVGVHDRCGPVGGVEERLRGTDGAPLAEVGGQHRERAQPRLAQGPLEGRPAHPRVLEFGRPADVGDAPVAEAQQVRDGLGDPRALVAQADARDDGRVVGRTEQHRGQAQTREQRGPGVVVAGVGEHGAVHPALGREPLVQRVLLAVTAHQVQQQTVAARRQLALYAGDQLTEVRVGTQHVRGAPHHQGEAAGARVAQCRGGGAGRPAQLQRGVEDPAPGRLGEPALVVEGLGHGGRRHPGRRRDRLDGGPATGPLDGDAHIFTAPLTRACCMRFWSRV